LAEHPPEAHEEPDDSEPDRRREQHPAAFEPPSPSHPAEAPVRDEHGPQALPEPRFRGPEVLLDQLAERCLALVADVTSHLRPYRAAKAAVPDGSVHAPKHERDGRSLDDDGPERT